MISSRKRCLRQNGSRCHPVGSNLLGEHVDYNDGLVLPVAIDRTVRAAIAARDDGFVHVRSLDLDASVSFSLMAWRKK